MSIYYHNFASQISHLINLLYVTATNQSMKVGTKIMSLVFLLNGVPGNLLPHPLNSETVQLNSTWITGVPVSHVHSTQEQCKMADVLDVHT